ncbi:MAG: hypothetical protein PSV24_07440, partial [Rhodoferax sp.]|nr:hypothetical protein [Rhodoferax sp.]
PRPLAKTTRREGVLAGIGGFGALSHRSPLMRQYWQPVKALVWPRTLRLSMATSALRFLVVGLFLILNGWRLQCTQAEATFTMLAVASGEVSEDAFAAWLRAHVVRRTP